MIRAWIVAAAVALIAAFVQPPILAQSDTATTTTVTVTYTITEYLETEVHRAVHLQDYHTVTVVCSHVEHYAEIYGFTPTWTTVRWSGQPGGGPPAASTPIGSPPGGGTGPAAPVAQAGKYDMLIWALRWDPVHLGWQLTSRQFGCT